MNRTAVIEKITTIASSSTTALKNIWEPLSKILSFSLADDTIYPSKNLTVSIEEGSISIAYGARLFSRVKIKGSKQYKLDQDRYPQPEFLASSLALTINEFRVSNFDVTLSIPKSWAIIKTVEFPSSVKENLPDVISYELDRITPLGPENALYDYRIIKQSEEMISVLDYCC